jgi:F420-dependent oxidoreductase-like protein
MKLGLQLGYWGSGPPPDALEQIHTAEALGFDSVWTAEAYGSDAFTPLAWWGSSTATVRLGTAIVQMFARAPTATAMAALTLDHLSSGRFILGLGVSGPQVVEGWYGHDYRRPLAQTREYIDIVRRVLARDVPIEYSGQHFQLPHAGGTGLGKPLKSTVHPLRSDLPIMLGAEGPNNVALAAEIADGWLTLFYGPKLDDYYRGALADGFARPSARHTADTFEVVATVPVVPGPDVEAAADLLRPMMALYVGGMGAKGRNFHYDAIARLGYEADCAKIQDLYLAGHKAEAIAAVPTAMVDDLALLGPSGRIKERAATWKDSLATTLLVAGPPPVLEVVADAVS